MSNIHGRLGGARAALGFKAPVVVATTANITLYGEQTIDGVDVTENDRVLVKNQTNAEQNGIYVCLTTAWRRATDFDGADDAVQGTLVLVANGDSQSGVWQVTTENPFVIGDDDISFRQTFGGALLSDNNLTDIANPTTALGNLGYGNVTTLTAASSTTLTPTTAAPTYYINSTTQKTWTIAAASSLPAICCITIYNSLSSARQTIAPNGVTGFFLWPGQQCTIIKIGSGLFASYDPVYKTTLASATIHVAASGGSDSNDGLDSSRPKATIQNALNELVEYYDCCENNPTIQLADGTYTEDNVYLTSPVRGTHVIAIQGNTTTRAAVTWQSTQNQVNLTVRDNGVAIVAGISFANLSTGGTALSCSQGGILDIRKCDFGAFSGGIHMVCVEGGQMGYSNESNWENTISGDAAYHWYCVGPSKILCSGVTIKAIGARTFSTSFARIIGGTITTAGVTFDTSAGSFNGVAYIRDSASTLVDGTALPGTQGYFTQDTRYTNGTPAFNIPYDGLFVRGNGSSFGVVLANGGTQTANRTWGLNFGDQNATLTLETAGNTTITNAAAGVINQASIGAMRTALGFTSAQAIIAASSAVTNTTTETAFDQSITVAANRLFAGTILRIKWQGIATATNATDTLTIRVKLGSVTLFTHAAQDVANNDVFLGQYDLTIRTTGASGTMVGFGTGKSVAAAEGTATFKDDILASTTVDTTATQAITVTAQWSNASASNSCRLDVLTAEYSF